MSEREEGLREEVLVADNTSPVCVPSGFGIWNLTISQHALTLSVGQPGLHCTQF